MSERRDEQGRPLDYGATKSGSDVDSSLSTASRGSTAGAGLGAKAPRKDPNFPKQEPGEDAGKYGARVRKYREENPDPELAGQKRALGRMQK